MLALAFCLSGYGLWGTAPSIKPRCTLLEISKASLLPSELLTLIIAELLPPSFDYNRMRWIGRRFDNGLSESYPNSNVLHACQINRSWYSAGIHLLYYRVVLYDLQRLQRFNKALDRVFFSRVLVRELVLFDEVKGVVRFDITGWRGWYRRKIAERTYRKHRDQARKLELSIISACSRLQRVSVHFCGPWRSSLTPQILDGSDYTSPLRLEHLLITKSGYHALRIPTIGMGNLRTLNIFDSRIWHSFIQCIPTGLPRLHSLTLINSTIEPFPSSRVYPFLRKIRSLRVLQLVNTGFDLPQLQIDAGYPDTCPCPENLERLSLIGSDHELDGSLAIWSHRGEFSSTLRELRISLLDGPFQPIKFPANLTTLMIFLYPRCHWMRRYTSILEKIRLLLEKNTSMISDSTFKSVIFATVEIEPNSYHFDNWTSLDVIREERLLKELCGNYGVELLKKHIPGMFTPY